MRATIKDIAKITGLSVSTVSRVLSQNPHVSPEAVDIVTTAAKNIGYIPNSAARSLINKHRGMIGLIVPEMENPYYNELIWGVEETASQHGFKTVLSCPMGHTNEEDDSVSKLLELGVDGIIHSGLLADESLNNWMLNGKIPSVLLGRTVQDATISYVIHDDWRSGYIGTNHLIKLGHKKIAFIFGKKNSFSSVRKLQGYKDALLEAGINFDEKLVKDGNLNFEGGMNATKEWLQEEVDFTAIMAGNDMMAFGAREAVMLAGLRIPEDISLVGIDDVFWSRIQGIELTTIQVPKYEMGKCCCEILLRAINDSNSKIEQIVLKGNLIERKSCRPI
jgi:LacI family transcriptional regulator